MHTFYRNVLCFLSVDTISEFLSVFNITIFSNYRMLLTEKKSLRFKDTSQVMCSMAAAMQCCLNTAVHSLNMSFMNDLMSPTDFFEIESSTQNSSIDTNSHVELDIKRSMCLYFLLFFYANIFLCF